MNKYKLDINLEEVFVTEEDPVYDGSFEKKQGLFRGYHSVVLNPADFRAKLPELARLYPKDDITVKIFRNRAKVKHSAKIQRIFSWYGLAPKVYRQVFIESNGQDYVAQVIQFISGDYCFDILEMRNIVGLMNQLEKDNSIYHNDDLYPSNVINGMWVDYGNFDFNNIQEYIAKVAVRYNNFTKWGNGVNSAYQKFTELGVFSGRDDTRIEMFELDKYNFEGKTVLDIGCSGGRFANYCDRRGARAVGVDLPEVIQGAREAANITGYHTEFYPYDFSKEHFVDTIRRVTGIQKFDFVFFLSMDQHIGFKEDYFRELVGDTLFFESNGGKPVEEEYNEFSDKLAKIFNSVNFKGVSKEGAHRNLFVCKTI